MQHVVALIDKASKICGNDSALAKQLKISKALISMMRSGTRAMTPGIAVALADIAGEDAHAAMAIAVIDGEKMEERRALLMEILGKGLAAGGAALLASSYKKGPKTGSNNELENFTKSEQAIHRI